MQKLRWYHKKITGDKPMEIDMKIVLAVIALIIMAIFAFSGGDVLNKKRKRDSIKSNKD